MIIETCKITVLVEDTSNPKRLGLLARHGLSLLIELVSQKSITKILLDAGPTPAVISHNLNALHIGLNDLDALMFSHGHYDHTDGFPYLLPYIGRAVPLIVHPNCFHPKFAYKPALTSIGSSFNHSIVDQSGGTLVASKSPVTIIKNVMTSGEIPLKTDFEKIGKFWTVHDNRFTPDLMIDEQALIINLDDKGLVVVTGCAHRGVINTIRHAQQVTHTDTVYAVIGGFHLWKATNTTISRTIKELIKIKIHDIYPCHCTGTKAVAQLINTFGSHCTPLHTGDTVTIL